MGEPIKSQTIGLIAFCVVVALNVLGLAVDAALREHGVETISDFARRNQWLAALIILINLAGCAGLILHFSNGR